MKRQLTLTLVAGLMLFTGANAQAAVFSAANLSLLPADNTVISGEAFELELFLDAADAPGSRPGLFGGEIVVDYDPVLFSFVSFSTQGTSTLFSGPSAGSQGGRQTVTLGFENAPEIGVVGIFEFVALGPAGSGGSFGLADADEFFGTFVSYLPTVQAFYPGFTGAEVAIVPLPAAAWLFASALGLIVVWRRQPQA
ncbi:MAG: hypothetical protein JJT85_03025 [Chromatiales bacterium]|nr:hypothetical protein [Chromatiales bacterium]